MQARLKRSLLILAAHQREKVDARCRGAAREKIAFALGSRTHRGQDILLYRRAMGFRLPQCVAQGGKPRFFPIAAERIGQSDLSAPQLNCAARYCRLADIEWRTVSTNAPA